MIRKTLLFILFGLLLASCEKNPGNAEVSGSVDLRRQAQQIAEDTIIVDTHIDVPYRLEKNPADISVSTDDGDFDYPRAVAGGLNAAFMSIYTPAELESEGRAKAVAESLIDMVEGIVRQSPSKFAIARTVADVRDHFDKGLISLPLGMENGSPIEGDLANLQRFFDRGIRYITLTHSLSNHISDSSYDENRQWNGLSEFGKEVIREMNHLGIMVDISHVSDEAFWQTLEISAVPVIASHSSARHFTPGFERNMSNEMIVALAENGGVIQINFGSTFVTQEARDYGDARSGARDQHLADNPELDEHAIYESFNAAYAETNGPMPYASLQDVLDHFDHVVNLVGIDHVGIGSDYDGVGDSLPTGLKDVASYPNLINGLLERGYSKADVRKILGENLIRVWQAAEDYAASLR